MNTGSEIFDNDRSLISMEHLESLLWDYQNMNSELVKSWEAPAYITRASHNHSSVVIIQYE